MSSWQAGLFLVAAASMAAIAHQVLRSRKPYDDTGGYWATVVARWCMWAVGPLLVFSCVRHASSALQVLGPSSPLGWLILTILIWAATLASAFLGTQSAEQARWLVGSIGLSGGRHWLLGAALPFGVAILNTGATGIDPFGAAQWAVASLVALALVAAAISQPVIGAAPALSEESGRMAEDSRPDWPAWMKSAGISLDLAVKLPETPAPSASPASERWAQILADRGALHVAPELARTVRELINASSDDPKTRCRLIFAAPGSGQEEVLALAASELALRTNETSLIIGNESVGTLTRQIARWCSPGVRVAEVNRRANGFERAQIWTADAEVVSDFLLSFLRDELHRVKPGQLSQVQRIGLIVWWNVETYSGVKASTIWAVSRRLHRMFEAHGRTGVRALAFSSVASDPGAQCTAFIEHLLPYPFDRDNEVWVPTRIARSTSVYVAKSGIAQAAQASAKSGWATAVEAGVDREEFKAAARHLPIDGKSLDQHLVLGGPAADAYLMTVQPEWALSLTDQLAQGGRYQPSSRPQYAALFVPGNPYLDFVVHKWARIGGESRSRFLVGAQGQPKATKRQAQEAIREVPDTMTGLQETFLWKEEGITEALHELFGNKQLHRRAVRFLDSDLRLRRDYLYTGTQTDRDNRPLETIGENLIEVRDPSVSGPDGLLMLIDRERCAIDAYPRRVLSANGRRYRVREWSQLAGKRIFCDPEDNPIRTWRGRTLRLFQLRRRTQTMRTGGISRYSVGALYREELLRVIEQLPTGEMRPIRLTTPVKTTFETDALILEVATTNFDALHTIAMALRHTLPVHVGIDSDFVEVIALDSGSIIDEGVGISGLAIVDLLPGGGIGLVEAIREDDALLQTILQNTCDWLQSAVSAGATAEQLFSSSPLATATGGSAGLDLQTAVKLLAHMRTPMRERSE